LEVIAILCCVTSIRYQSFGFNPLHIFLSPLLKP